jgi:hypothetical protein
MSSGRPQRAARVGDSACRADIENPLTEARKAERVELFDLLNFSIPRRILCRDFSSHSGFRPY